MGLLIDGVWHDQWYDTDSTGGRFERNEASFRHWITADGRPGPSGEGGFAAEPGRYHLYVSRACPWAHRTLIYRKLKGLEDMISLSVTHWFMGDKGWTFAEGPGVVPDPIHDADYIHQVYQAAVPDMTGRCTVPLIWDKQRQTIVTNESAEIIRMFNSAFDSVGATPGDYCPADQRDEIDALNERIYHTVNNGVYKAGFATTQQAYEEAVAPLFDTLDFLEDRLSRQRYLCGDAITEADWRLLPTLLRFDLVYHGHFKCNRRRIVDYPNLWGYTRDLYQQPGIADTCNFDHAKRHYYESHDTVNPTRIVPVGPDMDLDAPHGRG
ncbi:glutathione S-transferase family protein [Spectribacter hydrogenoxidans]|uniref:Glutathione S-transferase family protein n=1 Tax=Spectribacter hydrogenoxidans TaxID=3075608 RepID=A0ABU3BZ93_9GAMM|nr:glutathione S-transferase family protein [Salinisphaera sp. W335]MDT0634642.1 glutathione S-transferase family protein [Salinisphaera sp. W335]